MGDKLGTITLTGKSGAEYKFNVYPRDTKFKTLGAVYYVSKRYKKKDGSYSHKDVYIGQTEDLSQRFTSHNEEDCFNKHNANCISVHTDDNEKSRLKKEEDLVANYTPPCNG